MSELKKLKKDLDTIFSIFIRTRDSDENGIGKCITCGAFRHWKKADCGHYVKRQFLATRCEEKNCALQCKPCNKWLQGADEKFAIALDLKYGKGTVKMLKIKKFNKVKMGRFEYEILIDIYTNKVKAMEPK